VLFKLSNFLTGDVRKELSVLFLIFVRDCGQRKAPISGTFLANYFFRMNSIKSLLFIAALSGLSQAALATCTSWVQRQEFLCSNNRVYLAGTALCRDSNPEGKAAPTHSMVFCEKSASKSLKTCLANEGRDNARCIEEFKTVYTTKKQAMLTKSCLSSMRLLRDAIVNKYILTCHQGSYEELTRLAHLASFQLNKNQDVIRNCPIEIRKSLGKKILQATLAGRDSFKRKESSYTPGNGHQRCEKISRFLFNVMAPLK
jgi:hypothetical protein